MHLCTAGSEKNLVVQRNRQLPWPPAARAPRWLLWALADRDRGRLVGQRCRGPLILHQSRECRCVAAVVKGALHRVSPPLTSPDPRTGGPPGARTTRLTAPLPAAHGQEQEPRLAEHHRTDRENYSKFQITNFGLYSLASYKLCSALGQTQAFNHQGASHVVQKNQGYSHGL